MRMRSGRIFCNTVALISLLFIIAGCAQRKLSVQDDSLAGGSGLATLQGIKVSGDASQVEISADRQLTYTFYKLTAPPKAVIDLAQTEPGVVTSPIDVNAGNIRRIEVARHGFGESVLSRIEIALAKDGEFAVSADPVDKGKLLVTVAAPPVEEKAAAAEEKIEEKPLKVEELSSHPAAGAEVKAEEKPAEVAAKASPVAAEVKTGQEPLSSYPPGKSEDKQLEAGARNDAGSSATQKGRVLTAVQIVEDGVEVTVPGGVATFNSFRLTQPSRLVLDLHGIKSGVSTATIPLNSFGINKARLGVSPDKVRIVLDTVQSTLPPYQIVKTENGLKILFKGAAPAVPVQTVAAAVREPVKQQTAAASPAKPGPSSVEAIEFKAAGEYSQISVKVAGDCRAEKPVKVAGGWALTIKNCQLPRRLQRMLDTAAFASPVREITPYQVKVREGYDTKLLVKLRSEEPFNFKQEGNIIYWNIKNPESRQAAAPLPVEAKAAPAPASDVAQGAKGASGLEKEPVPGKQAAITQLPEPKHGYTGRKVTLEFSDADVRKIFQLIAEVSNLNFLISDDVSGTISLKLVNVPWDQALDVILESKNLEKRQEGNILYIKPRGKFRTIEQEEAAAREEREKRMELKTRIFAVSFAAIGDVAGQFEKLKSKNPAAAISPDVRTNRVIVTDIEDRLDKMGNLLKELDLPEKQVMIEARIVEATTTFTRDLGVQWGIHYQDGAASFLGINDLDTGFGGIVTQAPTTGTSGPGGAIGMSFGKLTSNIQIDLRLSAAATAGLIKIISTPKVVTLNNKAAKISQGQMIPYTNTTSAEGAKTEFIEAALTLEVTPHITADGNIGMKIKATNNSAGTGGTPPPINKKEATTELQVMNGETTVIGGIYVDSDTESNTGVPFLMDIPLLGWLFKSNSKNKVKTELLIFITPRIVS